ncbi:MAG: YggU family protein [Verrucomicrobia bacterium]|jgi:uncharacterized protein|nr:YggU family protein [Verrucomicrobiota bacterium]
MQNSGSPCIRETPSGIILKVRIQPRASTDEIVGRHGDSLKIRITAPPVDSAANESLVKFLSKKLDIPKFQIQLIKGQTSRNKNLLLSGLKTSDLPEAFLNLCAPS